MAQDEKGRRGGGSPGNQDHGGPSAARREAEQGKAAVVAPTPPQGHVSQTPDAAAEPADPGRAPPPTPTPPQAETTDESGATERMRQDVASSRKP